MNRAYSSSLALTLLLTACAGSEFTSTKDSGSTGGKTAAGGSHTAGGGSTDGGSTDGGSTDGGSAAGGETNLPAVDCQQLRQEFSVQLAKARICLPNAEGNCQASSVLSDNCGCETPVNPKATATKTARELIKQYIDANCETACPGECGQPVSSSGAVECKNAPGGADNVFTCEWAL